MAARMCAQARGACLGCLEQPPWEPRAERAAPCVLGSGSGTPRVRGSLATFTGGRAKVNPFPGWCFFKVYFFLKLLFQSNPCLVFHGASQGTHKRGWTAWEGKRRAAGEPAGMMVSEWRRADEMVPLCLPPRHKTFRRYLPGSTLLHKPCFISCRAVVTDGDFEDEKNHVGLSYQLVRYSKINLEEPCPASPPSCPPRAQPRSLQSQGEFCCWLRLHRV